MKLTDDESRALAFIAGLLLLSAAVRLAGAREPVEPPPGGLDVQAHIQATRVAVAETERARRPLGAGERIDPNVADAVELDRLPRVGPALAARIIEDREASGRFRSVEDLARVPGVGERVLEALRPHLALPAAPAASGGARAARGTGAASGPAPGERLDLNRADVNALTALPGIGPVLAARVVAYRDSAGPFRDVADLEAVKGIGPATVARLKELVRVGG